MASGPFRGPDSSVDVKLPFLGGLPPDVAAARVRRSGRARVSRITTFGHKFLIRCSLQLSHDRATKAATMTRLVDRLDQLARLPRRLRNETPRLDRVGGVEAMLQAVPVALWGAAACAVHPADAIPFHGWRLARLPAPLRLGVASQRLVHRPLHVVEPPLSCAPPTPSVGALTFPAIAWPPSPTWIGRERGTLGRGAQAAPAQVPPGRSSRRHAPMSRTTRNRALPLIIRSYASCALASG